MIGLPYNIVFHQEFITVLYFGAKKNCLGWEGQDKSNTSHIIIGIKFYEHGMKFCFYFFPRLGEVEHYLDFKQMFFLFFIVIPKYTNFLRQYPLYSCIICI